MVQQLSRDSHTLKVPGSNPGSNPGGITILTFIATVAVNLLKLTI